MACLRERVRTGPGAGNAKGAFPVRHEIIPALRYADAPRAIDFLCDAFGFTRRAVHASPDDPAVILHAELVWNDRMVMLASATDSAFARASGIRTPEQAGGATVTLCLVVDDVDAHAERARAAGARIFAGPEDQSYGGRSYSAFDPEGNIWNVGSYDPFSPA